MNSVQCFLDCKSSLFDAYKEEHLLFPSDADKQKEIFCPALGEQEPFSARGEWSKKLDTIRDFECLAFVIL